MNPKIVEKQMQILRLRLAQKALIFAQDDSAFMMRTLVAAHFRGKPEPENQPRIILEDLMANPLP
ncbi:MAG: hypothetical protein WAL75_19195 [Terracidiphilus sp.]